MRALRVFKSRESANDGEMAAMSCDDERSIASVVIAVNIGISGEETSKVIGILGAL